MKRILLATAASAMLATAATAEPVNLGIILGFTGPLESITPGMAASAELAMKEATDSGKLPGGITLNPVRADFDLHRRRRRHDRRPAARQLAERRRHRRRRLLRRDDRHRQQRRRSRPAW